MWDWATGRVSFSLVEVQTAELSLQYGDLIGEGAFGVPAALVCWEFDDSVHLLRCSSFIWKRLRPSLQGPLGHLWPSGHQEGGQCGQPWPRGCHTVETSSFC